MRDGEAWIMQAVVGICVGVGVKLMFAMFARSAACPLTRLVKKNFC